MADTFTEYVAKTLGTVHELGNGYFVAEDANGNPILRTRDEQEANDAVLTNALNVYATEIDWATRLVLDTLWGPGEWDEGNRNDVHREAAILVVTYHGQLPGWQSGKIHEWVNNADDIRAILSTTLRGNLMQTVGRLREKEYDLVSFEALQDTPNEPSYTIEDDIIGRVDAEAGIRKRYPTLCLNTLDGYTQVEIAKMKGISERTVRNWITKEKAAFEHEQVRKNVAFLARNGLNVEGDESPEELAEAAQYMTAYLNK